MTDPGDLAEYFGFTETEVEILCKKYTVIKQTSGKAYK